MTCHCRSHIIKWLTYQDMVKGHGVKVENKIVGNIITKTNAIPTTRLVGVSGDLKVV